MKKETDPHLQLLQKIKDDKSLISTSKVAEIFVAILSKYFEITKTGRAVRAKITEEEYIRFVNGFCDSFLTSIYVSSSKNKKEFDKRMAIADTVHNDTLVSKKVIKSDHEKK